MKENSIDSYNKESDKRKTGKSRMGSIKGAAARFLEKLARSNDRNFGGKKPKCC